MSTHISAKADHNHWDYHFRRQMSDRQKEMEWESRSVPSLGWGVEVLRLIGVAIVGCGILVILQVVG